MAHVQPAQPQWLARIYHQLAWVQRAFTKRQLQSLARAANTIVDDAVRSERLSMDAAARLAQLHLRAQRARGLSVRLAQRVAQGLRHRAPHAQLQLLYELRACIAANERQDQNEVALALRQFLSALQQALCQQMARFTTDTAACEALFLGHDGALSPAFAAYCKATQPQQHTLAFLSEMEKLKTQAPYGVFVGIYNRYLQSGAAQSVALPTWMREPIKHHSRMQEQAATMAGLDLNETVWQPLSPALERALNRARTEICTRLTRHALQPFMQIFAEQINAVQPPAAPAATAATAAGTPEPETLTV